MNVTPFSNFFGVFRYNRPAVDFSSLVRDSSVSSPPILTNFAIVFTGTTEIHDPELFGLIVAEVVELVTKAGLPGDQAPIFLDSESVGTDPTLKVRKGIKALQEYIEKS